MRIEAQGLVVHYPGMVRPALNDVSFLINPGQLYAVLGPNGSGKSTLMKALLGTSPVTQGNITFDERALVDWSRRELAQSVAALPQTETVAFPLTAREMVAMGRYPHLEPLQGEGDGDRIAVLRGLEACDVAELADRDVSTLSGGEFQRVRIARALAQEPRCLVLDEPTASLDIRHEMEIFELLRASTNSGMTVLAITHSLDTAAQFADRILLLSQGRVAAEGAPEEVLTEEILAAVYDWPLSVHNDARSGSLKIHPQRSMDTYG